MGSDLDLILGGTECKLCVTKYPSTVQVVRQMEPEPAPPSCWVCLEHTADESGALPQPTGCACRGGSTDHAHMGCVAQAAQAAQEKDTTWVTCPTCKQPWTGPMRLALCERRHALAADLPEGDGERLTAALFLAEALRVAGRYEEALRLGRATLATSRRILGAEHPYTLSVMRAVAAAHADSGDLEAALPLKTELAATTRRVLGDEHDDTLRAIEDFAVMLGINRNYHLALPLHQEVLAARRKTQGDGHGGTLHGIGNLAGTYANLWELERALPLRMLSTQVRGPVRVFVLLPFFHRDLAIHF